MTTGGGERVRDPGSLGRDRRRQGGACDERVQHPVDDDRYVLVDLDFPTREQAQRFPDVLGRGPVLAVAPARVVRVTPGRGAPRS